MSIVLDTIVTPSGNFDVTLAEPKDRETIRQMLIEAALWMNSVGVPQWNPEQFTVEEIDSYYASRELYLLVKEEEPIGFFTLQEKDPEYWGPLHVEGYSYLHRLTVRPSFQGQGLGSTMIHWAANRTKALGRLGLRLDCWTMNEKVNLLYQKLGFRHMGIGQNPNGRAVNLYEMNPVIFEIL